MPPGLVLFLIVTWILAAISVSVFSSAHCLAHVSKTTKNPKTMKMAVTLTKAVKPSTLAAVAISRALPVSSMHKSHVMDGNSTRLFAIVPNTYVKKNQKYNSMLEIGNSIY
jgi:hypothetical protein